MIRSSFLAVAAIVIATSPVTAQAVKSQITASNGVIVDLNADDFANRYEYSAPSIDFPGSPSGFVFVGKVKRAGVLGDLTLQGSIMYGGDWRYYSTALYKGGDSADYITMKREVIGCHYGSCSFSESFMINISPKDIAKHAENGVLMIQIRARESPEAVMLQIPTTYIDAVNEIAK